MALVVADRIKETTTTQGNGSSYALAGPETGFESFSVIGNGNKTYYCCTDGTDFEIGIGTYTASGTTLSRHADDVLQSSNNDGLVNWGSGTKDIFVTQPADKAVFLNADGDIEFDNTHRIKITSNTSEPVIDIGGSGPNFIKFRGSDFSDAANSVNLIYRTNPDDLLIETHGSQKIAEFGGDDGHAKLYYNDADRLETTSDGVEVIASATTAPSLTFGAAAGQIFKNENSELAVGLSNASPYPLYMQGRTNADAGRSISLQPLGGSVGIGTTSPSTLLHVDGDTTLDGDVTFTGANYNVVWDKSDDALEFADNAEASFGDDADLIIKHSGTASIIRDTAVTNARPLYLQSDETTHGVIITKVNATEKMARFIADGACELYHNDSLKFNTTTTGATVTGTLTSGGVFSNGSISDSQSAKGVYIGLSGSGDAQVSLVGDNTDVSPQIDFSHDVNVDYDARLILEDNGNRLAIKSHNGSSAENMARFISDGAVELYYDNNLRLNTTTDGATVTGGTGPCNFVILADTDNSNEDDVAKLTLSQDDGNVVGTLGFAGSGYDNPLILRNQYTGGGSGGGIHLKTGGDLAARFLSNAGAELYYDGSEALTTASSGIVTKSPVLTNQVTTGDARALFTHTIVGTNNASTQYVKLATLPATSDGTLDHLTLEGQVGGWESHRQGYFRISFSRRSGFNYYYDSYGDIIATAAIQAYTQTDNTVQIWGKFNASNYTKLSYSIPHSFQVTIEENPSFTGTAPSGTLAFDSSSSTYAPRFQVDNAGNLSATTKSFDIAHPTKENMRLRYGSLEGPENGVYVRGRLTGSSVI